MDASALFSQTLSPMIKYRIQSSWQKGDGVRILDFKQCKDSRFVTEEAFKGNSQRQIAALPIVLGVLKKNSLTDTNLRSLEFFFYTNTIGKTKLLAEELQKKEYSVAYRKSGYNKKQFVITGWTRKISIEDNALASWAKEMCELGFKYDCKFDGWGTDVDQ